MCRVQRAYDFPIHGECLVPHGLVERVQWVTVVLLAAHVVDQHVYPAVMHCAHAINEPGNLLHLGDVACRRWRSRICEQ